MSISLRNRLFFLIVLFAIFTQIPKVIQLNFIGSFLAKDLSFYPILIGVIYSFYITYKDRKNIEFTEEDKYFFYYIIVYVGVLLVSFINGIINYPYYDLILSGPADQIEKLPIVQQYLQNVGFSVDTNTLLQYWIFVRFIKGFILECFWYFTLPYMIYRWYRHHRMKGFDILSKAAYWAIILVSGYALFDIFYMSGSHLAEEILKVTNPIVHEIKYNGTWWPPLLWKNQLRSLFAEPSYYGIFAAFAMPMLWYKLVTTSTKKAKAIVIAVLLLFTYGLFLTKARTANVLFLSEVVLLVLFTLWYRNKSFVKHTVLIIVCSVIAFGAASFSLGIMPGSPASKKPIYNVKKTELVKSYVSDNIESIAGTEKRSNGARFAVFEASFAMGKDHPFLGVGKSFRSSYTPDYLSEKSKQNNEVKMWLKNQKEKGIMKSGFPALGEYVIRFAETGIIGLLVYLMPIIYLAIQLLKRIARATSDEHKLRYIFFFISFVGILMSGLIDNLYVTCCYYILMGLGYALISKSPERIEHEPA